MFLWGTEVSGSVASGSALIFSYSGRLARITGISEQVVEKRIGIKNSFNFLLTISGTNGHIVVMELIVWDCGIGIMCDSL